MARHIKFNKSKMTLILNCTKKLLDRIKPSSTVPDGMSSTLLGSWYATALFWKPQVALLVNEKTLLPVLMPLAPATNLATRFPKHLAVVLCAHGLPRQFIDHELAQMSEVQYAKTSNRSVVSIMNQFSYQAEVYREYLETKDLLALSLKLAETPCSPLYKSAISPDRELLALVKTTGFVV
ncbi:DUF6933 domain-containing protein [Limnobacter sp.]|uniref:DUF6933 domain-containing protein n=1 Tax=Limnobacter sp. TaxID=2003368 RepID=UPI002FE25D04